MSFKKITIILTSLCLVFAQTAFAKRMGGGRSYGMQRSISKPNTNYYNPQPRSYQSPQNTISQPQPAKQGMGVGSAALLGAAAGAAGGYMLGKNSTQNNVNASGTLAQAPAENIQPSTTSSIPWGIIGILFVLLILGLMIFKRKSAPGFNNPNTMNNNYDSNFNIPNIKRNSTLNPDSAANIPNWARSSKDAIKDNFKNPTMEKLPDGVELVYFLRQVKGMFLHIQSMNNPENISEVEKYMTPELYQELKEDIKNNHNIADFTQLDCQLLDCSLEKDQMGKEQLIASVQFSGNVSEEPQQPAKPFNEIWNFIKSDLASGKWLVAGIQQQ